MAFLHSAVGMQVALALSIFFGTFIYEDGATLLAAMLATHGALDPRIGLPVTFVSVWVGDLGLYALGSSVWRRTSQIGWLRKYLKPDSLAHAEAWFARRGWQALVLARAIPGSRLPLYVAAGALRLPFRTFARTAGICSAVWVSAIFALWWFVPMPSASPRKWLTWVLVGLVLCAPWLVGKSVSFAMSGMRGRKPISAATW